MRRLILIACLFTAVACIGATEQRPVLSAKGVELVKKIEQAMDAGTAGEAEALARELIGNSGTASFDAAIGNLMLSQILLAQEKFAAAIPPLDRALAAGMFEPAAATRYRKALAHLYYQTGDYQTTAGILADLANAPDVTPDVLLFYAIVLLQQGRFDACLVQAERLLQSTLTPSPEAYQIAAAAAQELKRTETVIGYLERLVELQPERETYWRQLVAAHFAAGNTLGALVALERAQAAGQMLDARDRKMRIEFYYNLNRYKTAIGLLEQGIADKTLEVDQNTWQLLAYCYDMDEQPARARATLERASRESPYSAIDLQLAERNWRDKRYADTLRNLDDALRKGDVDRPGDLWILMASAAMELRDFDRADKALAEARAHPDQQARVDRLERALRRMQDNPEP